MGLFGGRNRLRAYDPASMRMNNGIVEGDQQPIEMVGDNGFWQGGDKFGARDGIAGILAVIGDALAQQGGGHGAAMPMLMGGRLSAIEMAKKHAAEQQQQQALMEAARQRGINPADVTLAQGGLGGIIPKQGELPERARMAQWYQNASPQERAAFDQTNPIITNGYGSSVVPRNALPGGLDPDRYELIPDDEGGPASRAPGGFPPRFRR